MATRKKTVVRYRTRSRNGRISGFDLGTDLNIAVLVAIGIGGYLIYNYFNGGSGDSSPADTNTTADATAAADVAAQTAAGDPPNYDDTDYAGWASTIYQSGNTFAPMLSSPSAVLNIMNQMDNLADIYSLIKAFGTRQATGWSFSAQQYDLPGFIHAGFEDADIDKFNAQLGYNNVQYTF
jgi:hypothetical protein